MNEQIQELAEQASEYAVLNPSDVVLKSETEDVMVEIPKAFIDKFAELIVEECCNRLSEETILHDGYGYNQHELYNRLRKHFGVEE